MKTRFAATILALALAAGGALAQDKDKEKEAAEAKLKEAATQLDQFIVEMFKQHNNKTLCMLGTVPVPVVRGMVVDQLKKSGISGTATPRQLETAIWTVFPCPFSPVRTELLPATETDVEGVWLFPYESQPYRYGQSSPLQPTDPAKAVACEIVGYFPKGEYRSGTILGAKTAKSCTFRKAADLAPARKRPQVLAWSMGPNGRLKITRVDGKDYVEEWDIFAVTKTFQALNMEIKAGDLVAFLRRDKDNDVNASTEFRHLQRLK